LFPRIPAGRPVPLDLTVEEFQQMDAQQRLDWLGAFREDWASRWGAQEWFNALGAVLRAGAVNDVFEEDDYASAADAAVLHALQQGMALAEGQTSEGGKAATAWRAFFEKAKAGKGVSVLKVAWAQAEDLSTDRGQRRADALGLAPPPSGLSSCRVRRHGDNTSLRGQG
jgi:hypothetical protein